MITESDAVVRIDLRGNQARAGAQCLLGACRHGKKHESSCKEKTFHMLSVIDYSKDSHFISKHKVFEHL